MQLTQLTTFKSSTISACHMDFGTGSLAVTFNNGSLYTYYRVSLEDYTSFISAESQGAALSKYLKSYSYKKEESVEN